MAGEKFSWITDRDDRGVLVIKIVRSAGNFDQRLDRGDQDLIHRLIIEENCSRDKAFDEVKKHLAKKYIPQKSRIHNYRADDLDLDDITAFIMKHRPELPQPPPGYVARPRLPAARAAPPRQRPQKDKPTPDIDFIQIGNSGVAITIRQGKGAVSLNTNEQRFIYNSLEANESHSWICAELLDLQKRELRRQNKKSLASAIPLEMIERLRSSMSERIGKHPRKENGHWEKVQKPYGPGEYQTARAEDLPKAASATAAAPDPQHSHQASSYPDLYDQPSYPQPSYLQPSYPEPSYPQPSYLQPSYPQPSHQASSYPEPPNLYDRPSYRPSHHKPSPYEPSARQESAPQPINPRVAPLAGAPAAATENILPSIGEVLPREFPQSQRSRQGGRQGGYTSQSQPPRQLEPVSRAAPAQPYYQPSPYQQPAPRGPEPQPMVPQAAPFAGPPTGPWPAARENRLPSLQQALPDVFPQSQHSRQGDRQGGYTSQSQRPRQLDLVSRPAQAHPSRTSLAPPPALTGSKRTKSSSPGSTGDSSLSIGLQRRDRRVLEAIDQEMIVSERNVQERNVTERTAQETIVPEMTAQDRIVPEMTAQDRTAQETIVPEMTAQDRTVPETMVPEMTAQDRSVPETIVQDMATVPKLTRSVATTPRDRIISPVKPGPAPNQDWGGRRSMIW